MNNTATMRSSPSAAKNHKRKTWKLVLAVLLILAAVVIILRLAGVFYFPWENRPVAPVIAGSLLPGSDDAQDGLPIDKMTEEELMAYMQEIADANYLTVDIEARPVFENGSDAGYLRIINPQSNVYPIRVQYLLDETGEIIYDSGGVMPNQYIGNAKLTKVLKKGEYPCTAVIHMYDTEDYREVGNTEVAVILTVEN